MSPAEITTIYEGFKALGYSEADICSALEGDGFTVPGAKPAADAEAQALDALAPSSAVDPSVYDVGGAVHSPGIREALDGMDVNDALRTGFSSLGVAPLAARSLADELANNVTRFQRIPGAERSDAHKAARVALENALGKEAVAEAAEAYKQWQSKDPATVARLTEAGAFSSPVALGQLALITRNRKLAGR